jgi:hypothetical protein
MAQLPPFFLDALVAFEQGPDEDGEFNAVASGVLVGFDLGTQDENGQALYRVGLATARHVFEGVSGLHVKFNRGDTAARYPIQLLDSKREPLWRTHEDFDVAVIPINVEMLKKEGAEFAFVEADKTMADKATMDELGVFAGDDVYVLGFPMGFAGTEKKYAVVRAGSIARLDDEIIREEHGFWIDATVYPGNSGGPVVLRPSLFGIEGTKTISSAYLIGIVSAYIPYTDIAISVQTNRPRIQFEENSGLARVVPMDAVQHAFASFMSPPALAMTEPGAAAPEGGDSEPGDPDSPKERGPDPAAGG